MEKERLITKTEQTLQPLETGNVITFLKGLDAKSFTDHPGVTFLLVLVAAYALWRWTRFTLLTLFTVISGAALVRYAFPPAGTEITVSSTFPFVLGCMGIISVLLYFIFIRTD